MKVGGILYGLQENAHRLITLESGSRESEGRAHTVLNFKSRMEKWLLIFSPLEILVVMKVPIGLVARQTQHEGPVV